MNIIAVILGTIILVTGRRLYWLLVGLLSFMAGFHFAETNLIGSSQTILFLVALGVGLVGVLLAVVMERLAFALAGGFAGAYLAAAVAGSVGATGSSGIWMLIGGIVAALVAAVVMDWAIILLSSLAGAGMIVRGLALGLPVAPIVALGLAIVGILIQANTMPPSTSVANREPIDDTE